VFRTAEWVPWLRILERFYSQYETLYKSVSLLCNKVKNELLMKTQIYRLFLFILRDVGGLVVGSFLANTLDFF
jgi:hypothetical protein